MKNGKIKFGEAIEAYIFIAKSMIEGYSMEESLDSLEIIKMLQSLPVSEDEIVIKR